MKLSLVEVSPSMVMRLNERVGRLLDQRLQHAARDHGVGGEKAQHRRHVRPDHAGALADAGDR
jgi:hypothetical protein